MINIILFGITGFGNAVLEELLDHKLKPKKIITRKEIGPDPHLKMMQISDLAKKHNIPVQYNKDYVSGRFDLCIVATYHLLINLKKTNFKYAYNIHPSLLPKYKGKDPISEVIREKAAYSGVTLHELSEKYDDGKIVFQKKLKIIKHEKKEIMKMMLPVYRLFTRKLINNIKKNNNYKNL